MYKQVSDIYYLVLKIILHWISKLRLNQLKYCRLKSNIFHSAGKSINFDFICRGANPKIKNHKSLTPWKLAAVKNKPKVQKNFIIF